MCATARTAVTPIATARPIGYRGKVWAILSSRKPKLLARVRRLKGQIEAIERAIETDAGCAEVLHLAASVKGAMNGLTGELIEDHIQEHVVQAKDGAARQQGALDLIDVFRTYLK